MGGGTVSDYLTEVEEIECCHVLVYDKDNFNGMQSGIAEVEALDDGEIYVMLEDGTHKPFKRELVNPCFDC